MGLKPCSKTRTTQLSLRRIYAWQQTNASIWCYSVENSALKKTVFFLLFVLEINVFLIDLLYFGNNQYTKQER